MKVRLSELDCAARDALHAIHPDRFAEIARAAIDATDQDPELTIGEAGDALAALLVQLALVPGELAPDQCAAIAAGLHLASARIDGAFADDESVTLPPPAVAEHPLFGSWIGQDLGAALAHLVRAGAACTQLAPGAPTFCNLVVSDHGAGLLGVQQAMSWVAPSGRQFSTIASYGVAGLETPITRHLALQSTLFIGIGCRVPLVEQAARADEAAAASAIRAAAEAAGARVH